MTESTSCDVFISYKREERDWVVPIVRRLKAVGLRVWFDAQLKAGVAFDEEILSQLGSAKVHLVCWTKKAVESRWIRSEASIGAGRNILVPVFLEQCQLRPPFNIDHTVDLSDWNGAADHPAWGEVLLRVGELTGRGNALAEFEGLGPSADVQALRRFISEFPTDPLAQGCRERAYRLALSDFRRHIAAEFQLSPDDLDEGDSTLRSQLGAAEALLEEERASHQTEATKLREQIFQSATALNEALAERRHQSEQLREMEGTLRERELHDAANSQVAEELAKVQRNLADALRENERMAAELAASSAIVSVGRQKIDEIVEAQNAAVVRAEPAEREVTRLQESMASREAPQVIPQKIMLVLMLVAVVGGALAGCSLEGSIIFSSVISGYTAPIAAVRILSIAGLFLIGLVTGAAVGLSKNANGAVAQFFSNVSKAIGILGLLFVVTVEVLPRYYPEVLPRYYSPQWIETTLSCVIGGLVSFVTVWARARRRAAAVRAESAEREVTRLQESMAGREAPQVIPQKIMLVLMLVAVVGGTLAGCSLGSAIVFGFTDSIAAIKILSIAGLLLIGLVVGAAVGLSKNANGAVAQFFSNVSKAIGVLGVLFVVAVEALPPNHFYFPQWIEVTLSCAIGGLFSFATVWARARRRKRNP